MLRLLFASLLLVSTAAADTTQWRGQSIALRVVERGLICQAGSLSITLDGQTVSAKLTTNEAKLTGTLTSDGALEMRGQKGAFIYSFTGKRDGQAIRGSWIDAGSGCGGIWSAKPADAED
jgi:hypothetical protein